MHRAARDSDTRPTMAPSAAELAAAAAYEAELARRAGFGDAWLSLQHAELARAAAPSVRP